jgi:hypothetical protein
MKVESRQVAMVKKVTLAIVEGKILSGDKIRIVA